MRDAAFADFHDRFQRDPLVLDKWMGLQALSPLPDTVTRVRALMEPCRLRHPQSQPGARADRRLHRPIICASTPATAPATRLVGEIVRRLDAINPQIAARLAGAFENWRRYDAGRQGLMRAELEAIAEDGGPVLQPL